MNEYILAGEKFTQKPLVFGQMIWIRDILCGKKLQSVSAKEYSNIIIGNLPRFLAIVLLKDGETQAEKDKAGEDGMLKLEGWIKGNIQGAELFSIGMAVMNDFFACNPGEMAILIDGEIKIPERESALTG